MDFTTRPDAPFGTIMWYSGVVDDRRHYEQTVPTYDASRKALSAWRDASPVRSRARWVFPVVPNAERLLDHCEVRRRLRDATTLAKLTRKKFSGWQMFRCCLATTRELMPLCDLASVDGRRDTETLMKSYDHGTTEGTLKVAL